MEKYLKNLSTFKTILNEFSKATIGSFSNSVITQFGFNTNKNIYRLKNGIEVIFKPKTLDLMVIRECLINNLYIKYIREKNLDTVLDLGSHKGYFITGLLSHGVNIKRAICVDPLAENIDIFKKNIKANKDFFKKIESGVIFESSAISLETGKRGFFITKNSVNHSLNDPSKYDEVIKNVVVDTISIKDLFNKYKLSSISLIKIDIEGTEFDLFRSKDYELLLKTKYLVMEIHPNEKDLSTEIIEKLINSGFIIKYPNPAYKNLIVAIREK
jgi:FkbM family methyltransferase